MVHRVTIHVERNTITDVENTFAGLDYILADVGIDFTDLSQESPYPCGRG